MAAQESNNPESLSEVLPISRTAVEDGSVEKVKMDEEKSGDKFMEAGPTHGVSAPPELDMNLPSVEDRLRELTEKFHHNEKQHELDRSPGRFQPPLPVPSDMQLLRIQAERYSRPSGRGEAFDSAKRHRLDLMSMYRRELEFLEREDVLFEELAQDRGDRSRSTKVYEFQGERRSTRSSSRSSVYGSRQMPEPRADAHQPGVTQPIVQIIVPGPPKYATPKLNYVEWVEFKGIRDKREKDSFAIDVLKGEPVIVFVDTRNLFSSTKSLRHGKQAEITVERKGTVNLKHQVLPGQAPFPERIRINSSPIIKVLTQIYGTKLRPDEFTPIIMIKPFKTLAYYSSRIQQRLQELETKIESQNSLNLSVANHHDMDGGSVPSKSIAISDGTKADIRGPLVDYSPRNSNQITEQNEDVLADGTSTYSENFDDEDRETMSITTLEHLRCLNDFLNTEIQTKPEYLRSDRCKNVAFDDLWYLFRPGDEVVGQHRRQAYRIISVTGVSHQVIPPWKTSWDVDKSSDEPEEAPVILKCVYVDFDGKQLGPVTKIFEIPRYDGEKAVKVLEVYPIRFAEDSESTSEVKDAFRKSLIARGRKFLSVLGMKHMYYNGFTLETKDEVDSQVVVDFEEAFASRKEDKDYPWMPRLEVLIGSPAEDRYPPIPCRFDCCKDESIHLDTTAERRRNEEYISTLIPLDRNEEPSVAIYPRKVDTKVSLEGMVTDDELVIMSHRVFGFILHSRKWAKLDLAFLHPINSRGRGPISEHKKEEDAENIARNNEGREETAFDQLVLPDGHKKMVVSLIAQHFRDKESAMADEEQTDIVRGKGKGLIILLHGLPGVGKTTTAEGVAELFKKPLFQITCGDLGTTASEVETALEKHFSLASRWGCILLLDEADVFLAARTPQDFIRNGLVSVFLRVLEYYAGILFLTTNRIGDFDEAFASRIHISLHYPELSLEPTLEIFKLNMRLIRERRNIEIDEESILAFADHYWRTNVKMRWNGRQIRNACQTALALAEFDAQGGNYERVVDANAKVKLTVAHLEIVSKAYLDFIMYLKKIYGQTGERRAKAMGIRAREEVSGNKYEGDEGEREGTMVAEGKKKMTTENPYASFPQPTPQPSQSAPVQAVYPYGPPPAAQPGAYPPGPVGPGYYYPPQGYPAPPPSWQPPPGALGQYGSAPLGGVGRQSKEWK